MNNPCASVRVHVEAPLRAETMRLCNNTVNRGKTTTCGVASGYESGFFCLGRFGRRGGGGAIQGKRARFGPVMKAACFSNSSGRRGDVAEWCLTTPCNSDTQASY